MGMWAGNKTRFQHTRQFQIRDVANAAGYFGFAFNQASLCPIAENWGGAEVSVIVGSQLGLVVNYSEDGIVAGDRSKFIDIRAGLYGEITLDG